MPAAAPAMPAKPKNAAIRAITKNPIVQPNMGGLSVVGGRSRRQSDGSTRVLATAVPAIFTGDLRSRALDARFVDARLPRPAAPLVRKGSAGCSRSCASEAGTNEAGTNQAGASEAGTNQAGQATRMGDATRPRGRRYTAQYSAPGDPECAQGSGRLWLLGQVVARSAALSHCDGRRIETLLGQMPQRIRSACSVIWVSASSAARSQSQNPRHLPKSIDVAAKHGNC